MSQERLAELCGMHRDYVGAVERAERPPSIVAADCLAGALGTTLASMFSEPERNHGASSTPVRILGGGPSMEGKVPP